MRLTGNLVWSLWNLKSFILVMVCVDLGSFSTVLTVIRPSLVYNADKIRIHPFLNPNQCSELNADVFNKTIGECQCRWENGAAYTFMSDRGQCRSPTDCIKTECPNFFYASSTDGGNPRNIQPINLSVTTAQFAVYYTNGQTSHRSFKTCSVLQNQTFLDAGIWNSKSKMFSLSQRSRGDGSKNQPYFLKWDSSKNYKKLHGKLFKVDISCGVSRSTLTGCMILKIQGSYSYTIYPPTFTPTSTSTAIFETAVLPEVLSSIITPSSTTIMITDSSTVLPNKPGGNRGGGSRSEQKKGINSTVVVAVISSVATVICVAIISISVCYIVRKKPSVLTDKPDNLAAGSSNTIIQNTFCTSTNLRNPSYHDFEQSTIYAECAENPTPIPLRERHGSHTQKNINTERTSTIDSERHIVAHDSSGIYQPLIQTQPKMLSEYTSLTEQDGIKKLTKETFSELDKNKFIPGPPDCDPNRPLENETATACPGGKPTSMDHVLGDATKSNSINSSPKYEPLILQNSSQEYGYIKFPVNEPEYGVLENPEYGVLEDPESESEHGVPENYRHEPEYGVLENSRHEPEYGVLENPENEPECGALEHLGHDPEYDVLDNSENGRECGVSGNKPEY